MAVRNTTTERNMGRKDLFHSTLYSLSSGEARAGTRSQDLKVKLWRNLSVYGLLAKLIFSYLSYTSRFLPWVALPMVVWVLPTNY